jgi:hypothetical protein
MKNSFFWDIMPYNLLKVDQRFGRKCCLPSSGLKSNPSKKQAAMIHSGFLLGLLFNPEDADDILQNIG